MSNGTAPAWHVREGSRQKLLAKLEKKIIGWEKEFTTIDFSRVFALLIVKQLAFSQSDICENDLPEIPIQFREQTAKLFREEVAKPIRDFQRTDIEGNALLAELIKSVAQGINQKCRSALERQADENPKLIYGVADESDEVPIE